MDQPSMVGAARVLVIEAGRTERHYWADMWAYRELLGMLAWRDVAVRYKQTVIGVAWAIARPLLTMLVFTVVFGRLANLPSEGAAPYALMVLAGMLPWFLFSTIFAEASASLVSNSNLIAKVYFPRMIIPAAASAVAVLDFCVNLLLYFCVSAAYGLYPSWRLLLLPLLLVFTIIVSLGPALLISAMNVKFRDFRYVVPFLIQFGLYISPVGFSTSVVPEQWKLIYNLNPMVGIIDGFRWCLLGTDAKIYLPGILCSLCVVVLSLFLGIAYFRKTEKSFADVI